MYCFVPELIGSLIAREVEVFVVVFVVVFVEILWKDFVEG